MNDWSKGSPVASSIPHPPSARLSRLIPLGRLRLKRLRLAEAPGNSLVVKSEASSLRHDALRNMESAAISTRELKALKGEERPLLVGSLLNGMAALLVAEKAASLTEGWELAEEMTDSYRALYRALAKLAQLAQVWK